MTTRKIRKPASRTTPRVSDDEPAKKTTKSARNRGSTQGSASAKKLEQPEGAVVVVTCQASELVPVAQYANVTVGPIAVQRTYYDTGNDDDIEQMISRTQMIVTDVISTERELVEQAVREINANNEKMAEESEKKGRRR